MATVPSLNPVVLAPQAWPSRAPTAAHPRQPPLDMARVGRTAVAIVALLLVNKFGDAGAAVFFAVLAVMVFSSPQNAFKALAIAGLGLMLHYGLVPKSLVWTPSRLVLPFLVLLRFSFDATRLGTTLFASPTYVAFVLYLIVMAICSVLSGWYSQIALLKLLNFWVAASAVLAGVMVLRRLRVDLTEWFISLIAAATLMGMIAILLGIHDNFRGASKAFVGAFLHPNCHSVYGSLFVTMLASTFLLGEYPRRRIVLPMLIIWVMFNIWSKSRASMAASIMGFLVLMILAQPFRNRFGWRLHVNVRPSQVFGFILAVVAIGGVVDLATQGSVSRPIIAFINKSADPELTTIDAEQVLASRQGLIDLSWKNFQERPLTGIGFQVATNEAFIKNATLFTAPAEKGFLVTAVLEEGGIIGATAFVFFLVCFFGELFAARNVPGIAMLVAFLTANMAEVTFFSPGGSGAFGWLMIGAAMILGDHCWRRPTHTRASPGHRG